MGLLALTLFRVEKEQQEKTNNVWTRERKSWPRESKGPGRGAGRVGRGVGPGERTKERCKKVVFKGLQEQ